MCIQCILHLKNKQLHVVTVALQVKAKIFIDSKCHCDKDLNS